MKVVAEYYLGDMVVRYMSDEEMHVGMELYPVSKQEKVVKGKMYQIDSLVQWKDAIDAYPYGFANGFSMRQSESTLRMKWKNQYKTWCEGIVTISTVLEDTEGNNLIHTIRYTEGERALWVDTEFQNRSNRAVTLEMLSSFSIGGLTPFAADEATDTLLVHKMRSKWSTEGRMESRTAEELLLEPTWSRHGVYSDKFGQTGSLPVRGYFPFVAVEDKKEQVVWAAALECPSSWQMEVYRRDEALSMSGGLADYDYGHWCKQIEPGGSFKTASACLTVCCQSVDVACQRLSSLWDKTKKLKTPPVIFNEFCTTWGKPSHQNISRILKKLKGSAVQYFVIDAGWYADPVKGWESNMGDWKISKELFPKGMKEMVQEIQAYGFIPGIWFEFETCGADSEAYYKEEHLLKRNGRTITAGGRRFWDMRDPWTVGYLAEKVIDFLKEYGFKYLKADYNESIGVGCDGAESLGEGLRQNMQATEEFFRRIQEEIPDLVLEICASGGHRMEPSMLRICDLVSISDAHEEKEIPVIAANIQRLVPPGKSEIWSVLRRDDSIKRLVYSMTNTFLGVMCLSGDICEFSQIQWEWIERGIEFYKCVGHIIQNGVTNYYGTIQNSWRKLTGWQGVVRYSSNGDEILCVIHRFEAKGVIAVDLPVGGEYMVCKIYEEKPHEIKIENGILTVILSCNYEAIAILLEKEGI